jgi:hypothetical protein
VHQWKYEEGEGEEEVEERKKIEEKERKKKRPAPPEPPMKVRPLELRKEALDTLQRLKMKVEPAVKFSLP